MQGFQHDDVGAETIEAERALFEPFTTAVRDLVDATIRTEVPAEEIRAAQAEIEAVTARLRRAQLPGSYGVRFSRDESRGRPWGNAVIGLRNPIAPPLVVEHHADDPEGLDGAGRIWAEFHLGAAYEGPPGCVHGGVLAMVLDQMLGQSAGSGGRPGMTGGLTLTYRRPTPLGPLRTEAWIDRSEGYKTWAKGQIIGPEGVTVEAEGIFILPRWAREVVARQQAGDDDARPPRYFE